MCFNLLLFIIVPIDRSIQPIAAINKAIFRLNKIFISTLNKLVKQLNKQHLHLLRCNLI